MKRVYNHLLLKDGIGKSKPTTRDLPDPEFIYGKPEIRDPEGASEGIFLVLNFLQLLQVGNSISIAKLLVQIKITRDLI
jgi:hypothetical protein